MTISIELEDLELLINYLNKKNGINKPTSKWYLQQIQSKNKVVFKRVRRFKQILYNDHIYFKLYKNYSQNVCKYQNTKI